MRSAVEVMGPQKNVRSNGDLTIHRFSDFPVPFAGRDPRDHQDHRDNATGATNHLKNH